MPAVIAAVKLSDHKAPRSKPTGMQVQVANNKLTEMVSRKEKAGCPLCLQNKEKWGEPRFWLDDQGRMFAFLLCASCTEKFVKEKEAGKERPTLQRVERNIIEWGLVSATAEAGTEVEREQGSEE